MNNLDLTNWKPEDGDTGVVLHFEMEPEKGSRGRLSALLHTLPLGIQSMLNLNGCYMTADLRHLHHLVSESIIKNSGPVKFLKYDLQCRYPAVFGAPDNAEFAEDYAAKFGQDYRILETFVEGEEVIEGYHKYACPEPLVLEPEDWCWEEWKALCKLCGMNPFRTERMVLNVSSLEVFVGKDNKPVTKSEQEG